MRRHLRHLAISAALLLGGAAIFTGTVLAEPAKKHEELAPGQRNPALDEMSMSQLLGSVKVGKYAPMIEKFQNKEALKLINMRTNKGDVLYDKKDGFLVETERNKEVIVLTIPTDMLFLPNETELMETADKYLAPLTRYLRVPDMYRMVLEVHTDNTGSIDYTNQLALDRVGVIFDWFANQGCDTSYVFPFAMGAAEPKYPNISGDNRARNRRLEVYLVPGEEMMRQAKSGRIQL